MNARIHLQPAYVLHRRPYRETSLLLEIFTRDHGRLGLVARGVRGARARAKTVLQAFVPLLVSWSGRGDLGTLGSFESNGFAPLPRGRALYSAFYLNEVLMRVLTRHDPHPEVFAVYVDVLEKLGTPAVADRMDNLESVLRLFEKKLLEAIGYGLVFFDEEGESIDIEPDRQYLYVREFGPKVLPDTTAKSRQAEAEIGVKVSGGTLAHLRDEKPLAGEELNEAKKLMRFLLEPLLGERPLGTRQVFSLPTV